MALVFAKENGDDEVVIELKVCPQAYHYENTFHSGPRERTLVEGLRRSIGTNNGVVLVIGFIVNI